MTYRVERKKWILYRHTNNFELLIAVAVNLKGFSNASISREDKKQLLLKLKDLSYYKERNPEMPLDSINHRINTLAYYMFGYKDKIDGHDRFLFSPLGNLFLKNIDNRENINKIFLTMLWSIQFEHPHGGSDKSFDLYPFRLIFKLLSDIRLDNRLYAFEVAYVLVFVDKINGQTYEELVQKLTTLRRMSNDELKAEFEKDSHTYVNSAYEWDYYVSELLKSAGILEKFQGEIICHLTHGKNTLRRITRNYVKLNPILHSLYTKLDSEYPFTEIPLKLNDPERMRIDVIKEIYSFYPQCLLDEIGLQLEDGHVNLLNLTKLIEKYSNNNEGSEAYLFEDVLVDGFNMFINVEAKKIGGAGKTDIECLYISKEEKFAVDAKSTKNKLSGINSGRLAEHRNKIGGKYTIVVTPRYVPAVLTDINNSPIVIIRASTFSEYLYNHIDHNMRDIDYADFDIIIKSNLGKDISREISELTFSKFSSMVK